MYVIFLFLLYMWLLFGKMTWIRFQHTYLQHQTTLRTLRACVHTVVQEDLEPWLLCYFFAITDCTAR